MLSTMNRHSLLYCALHQCLYESDYQNKIDSHNQKIEDAIFETADNAKIDLLPREVDEELERMYHIFHLVSTNNNRFFTREQKKKLLKIEKEKQSTRMYHISEFLKYSSSVFEKFKKKW
jgi:hypothetical protein